MHAMKRGVDGRAVSTEHSDLSRRRGGGGRVPKVVVEKKNDSLCSDTERRGYYDCDRMINVHIDIINYYENRNCQQRASERER